LSKHINNVWAIAISPNGRILASASLDDTARLWNLDNGQSISLPLQHAYPHPFSWTVSFLVHAVSGRKHGSKG
ncbi:hypothetical protein BDR05DRAFT_882675, partial [Suillus weaverae]